MKSVPEQEIEDIYEHGREELERSLQRELPQLSEERKVEIASSYQRNRSLVKRLNETYEGRCQVCAFDPLTVYGVNATNAHHIQYLSRGGVDVMENMVLICPNHHTVIHGDEAVFDYQSKKFIFRNGRHEPLALNHHL